MKGKQRISLVALIITIIVLIILTGAVIMTMNKGDTIGKSKEAVFKSDLSNYREEVSRNILNEQVKENVGSMKDVTVIPSDANYATEIKKYIPNITSDYIGKLGIKEGNLYYIDTSDEEKFGLAAELNMIDISDTLAGKVHVGEYIEYTPSVGSYTVEKTLSGTTGAAYEQWCSDMGETQIGIETFTTNASEETWRVLSVDGANVTIMRGEPITNVALFGQTGYDNAEEVLNKICSIYKNETYAKSARSITIEDINKVIGYVVAESANPGEGAYGYLGYGDNKCTYYGYNNVNQMPNMSNTTDNRYTMIFKNNANTANKSYWVASRCVYARSTYTYFNVRGVYYGGMDADYLCNVGGDEGGSTHGACPVVVLKSTVSVANGSGTPESP